MKKKTIENLEEFFQKGIVSDLRHAIHHYVIWRTIGENFLEIQKIKNRNLDNILGELQSSSHDLAVLHLAKIFDNKDRFYLVRCVNELLDYNFQNNSYFPLHTKDYIEFSLISSRLSIDDIPSKFENPNELAGYFKIIFNSVRIKSKVQDSKFIRDKFLAHNEHDVDFSHLGNYWEDFLFLIDFLKIFVSLFGVTILNSEYFQFKDYKEGSLHYSIISDLYWLVEEIQKEIGKENFKIWWND